MRRFALSRSAFPSISHMLRSVTSSAESIYSYLHPATAEQPETLSTDRIEALRKHYWAQSEMAEIRQPERVVHDLRVCTFNLLAPCYKRLTPSSGSNLKRESEDAALWHERNNDTLQFIRQHILPNNDIVGLQEYWFDQDFEQRLADAVGPEFEIRTHRRNAGKADGLALLLRKTRFEILAEKSFMLTKIGSRVGLSVLLHDRWSKQRLLMTVTHLSFPHCSFSRDAQLAQARSLVSAITEFAKEQSLGKNVARIIMGDFNSELSDPVCQLLVENGYVDSFSVVAAAEGLDAFIPEGPRFVSHRNHRQESVGVDHIFFQPAEVNPDEVEQKTVANASSDDDDAALHQGVACMFVNDWYMLPADMGVQRWHDDFVLSDHRPVNALFRVLSIDAVRDKQSG